MASYEKSVTSFSAYVRRCVHTRSCDAVKMQLITSATALATLGSYIKPMGHSYIIHPKRAHDVPRLLPSAACNKNKMTWRPRGVMTPLPRHLHKALRGWTRAMPNKSLWFMRVPERTDIPRQRDICGRWSRSREFRLLIGTFALMLYPYQSLSPILHHIEHERIILTYISCRPMFPGPRNGLKDSKGKEKKIRRTGKLERPRRDKSTRENSFVITISVGRELKALVFSEILKTQMEKL